MLTLSHTNACLGKGSCTFFTSSQMCIVSYQNKLCQITQSHNVNSRCLLYYFSICSNNHLHKTQTTNPMSSGPSTTISHLTISYIPMFQQTNALHTTTIFYTPAHYTIDILALYHWHPVGQSTTGHKRFGGKLQKIREYIREFVSATNSPLPRCRVVFYSFFTTFFL